MINNPIISKILEVYSGHITEKDNTLLAEWNPFKDIGDFYVYDLGFHARIFVGDNLDFQLLEECGFSSAFMNIINYAIDNGMKYVDIDPDVKPYMELPTFEW